MVKSRCDRLARPDNVGERALLAEAGGAAPMTIATPLARADGFRLLPGYLSPEAQARLAELIRRLTDEAPFFRPAMPRTGTPFSVRMTNFGPLGWVSDRGGGYRYQASHPETGRPWPPIPQEILAVWRNVSGYAHDPEACLVNLYEGGAKMGLHRDGDEAAKDAAVVSISLGDSALFRLGGANAATKRVRCACRPATSSFSAAPRGTSSTVSTASMRELRVFLPGGGRINVTLRRVTVPST